MNTNTNLVHVIAIDDSGGVVVSEDKTVLVRELVRHYTPTWQGKADACRNAGAHYSLLQDVSALLNSLGIEHCVFVDNTELVVLGPAYAESYGEPPETYDNAPPEDGPPDECDTPEGGDEA